MNVPIKIFNIARTGSVLEHSVMQGATRYGRVSRDHNYMTRLIMETKAYKRTGNREHLYNIANYCVLECIAPENGKHHFDGKVDSVTRGKV